MTDPAQPAQSAEPAQAAEPAQSPELAQPAQPPRPVPLTAEDAQRLGIWRTSALGSQALARQIAEYPDLCWRAGNDHALGGLWRRRPEVGEVIEMAGRAGRPALLAALVEAFRRRGCRAVVVSTRESHRLAAEYAALGWATLDDIVYYRFAGSPVEPAPLAARIRDARPADLPAVLALDHAAFTWLWWESEGSLGGYLDEPGRLFWIAELDGRPVGYLAANVRARYANFDRLGVHPDAQGHGIGRGLLTAGLAHFLQSGVTELTLNTQASNQQSRRLYQGVGFAPVGDPQPLLGLTL